MKKFEIVTVHGEKGNAVDYIVDSKRYHVFTAWDEYISIHHTCNSKKLFNAALKWYNAKAAIKAKYDGGEAASLY